ncbi:MAG: hypothetical protein KBC64_00835 [Simkaniaceae bacterium]|nr:hypothetical protein [Simkaniaceae bacterium]
MITSNRINIECISFLNREVKEVQGIRHLLLLAHYHDGLERDVFENLIHRVGKVSSLVDFYCDYCAHEHKNEYYTAKAYSELNDADKIYLKSKIDSLRLRHESLDGVYRRAAEREYQLTLLRREIESLTPETLPLNRFFHLAQYAVWLHEGGAHDPQFASDRPSYGEERIQEDFEAFCEAKETLLSILKRHYSDFKIIKGHRDGPLSISVPRYIAHEMEKEGGEKYLDMRNAILASYQLRRYTETFFAEGLINDPETITSLLTDQFRINPVHIIVWLLRIKNFSTRYKDLFQALIQDVKEDIGKGLGLNGGRIYSVFSYCGIRNQSCLEKIKDYLTSIPLSDLSRWCQEKREAPFHLRKGWCQHANLCELCYLLRIPEPLIKEMAIHLSPLDKIDEIPEKIPFPFLKQWVRLAIEKNSSEFIDKGQFLCEQIEDPLFFEEVLKRIIDKNPFVFTQATDPLGVLSYLLSKIPDKGALKEFLKRKLKDQSDPFPLLKRCRIDSECARELSLYVIQLYSDGLDDHLFGSLEEDFVKGINSLLSDEGMDHLAIACKNLKVPAPLLDKMVEGIDWTYWKVSSRSQRVQNMAEPFLKKWLEVSSTKNVYQFVQDTILFHYIHDNMFLEGLLFRIIDKSPLEFLQQFTYVRDWILKQPFPTFQKTLRYCVDTWLGEVSHSQEEKEKLKKALYEVVEYRNREECLNALEIAFRNSSNDIYRNRFLLLFERGGHSIGSAMSGVWLALLQGTDLDWIALTDKWQPREIKRALRDGSSALIARYLDAAKESLLLKLPGIQSLHLIARCTPHKDIARCELPYVTFLRMFITLKIMDIGEILSGRPFGDLLSEMPNRIFSTFSLEECEALTSLLRTYRYSMAPYIYAVKHQSTPVYLEAFTSLMRHVVKGSFLSYRYSLEGNPHLEKIAAEFSAIFDRWKAPFSLSLNRDAFPDTEETQISFKNYLKKMLEHRHGFLEGEDQFPYLTRYFFGGSEIKEGKEISPFEEICIKMIEAGEESQGGIASLLKICPERIELRQNLKNLIVQMDKKKRCIPCSMQITDDFQEILLSGTEVRDSCQRVDGDPYFNRGLLGALGDGKTKMVVIHHPETYKIENRALIRLLVNEEGVPVLFMETAYGNGTFYEKALRDAVLEYAKYLGVKAYGYGVGEEIPLFSHGSNMPCEYVDAVRGVVEGGIYTFNACEIGLI